MQCVTIIYIVFRCVSTSYFTLVSTDFRKLLLLTYGCIKDIVKGANTGHTIELEVNFICLKEVRYQGNKTSNTNHDF